MHVRRQRQHVLDERMDATDLKWSFGGVFSMGVRRLWMQNW
jgi:hypothetical protein